MNEMCLATTFIMNIALNVIWKTCDVFYVYKWLLSLVLIRGTLASLLNANNVCKIGSYVNDA